MAGRAGLALAVEDVRVFLTFGVEESANAAFRARQRVIDQNVLPRNFERKFDGRRTARRYERGLNVGQRGRGEGRLIVNAIEDFTDEMQRRDEVGAADAKVDTNRVPDVGVQRVLVLSQRASRTVEDEVLWFLVHHVLIAEVQMSLRAEGLHGVDLALHHIELVIHRRQSTFRLDKDHAIHPAGDMVADARGRAVIDE